MREYEYSFRVNDTTSVFKYCNKQKYGAIHSVKMSRTIYKNNSTIIARITAEVDSKEERLYLDFKEDSGDNALVKNIKESPPISLRKEKTNEVKDLLTNLGYTKYNHYEKKRTSYIFNTHRIDIDEYTRPYTGTVVEIEGEPQNVKEIYEYLKQFKLKQR